MNAGGMLKIKHAYFYPNKEIGHNDKLLSKQILNEQRSLKRSMCLRFNFSFSFFISLDQLINLENGCLSVDFEVDDDVNSEVLLNSADMEGRKVDEDGMIGCSVEAIFQNNHDIKFDQDESKTCMVPFDGAHIVNNSIIVEEPYVGKEFDSEAAAHAFYNLYATKVGFVIRVSKLSRSRRDGSAIGRALVCNKEGFRTPDKREKIVRQRAETRVGCRAMVLVRKISSGKWVITKFVKEHTHPFTPGKGRRDLIYDQYPNEHDKIRELSQQLAIEKRRSATYKRHLEMVFEYIEEHNQSLSKRIEGVVNNISAMESKDIETRR